MKKYCTSKDDKNGMKETKIGKTNRDNVLR